MCVCVVANRGIEVWPTYVARQMMLPVLLLRVAGASSPLCSTTSATKSVEIADGVCMPFLSNGDVMKHTPSINDTMSSSRWLAAGGRGLDTAWSYDHGGYGLSQRQMGVAIEQSGVPREQIFITSKIPCNPKGGAAVALSYDLQQLNVKQLDLVLIHTPSKCSSADIAATWAGMQSAKRQNLTRAIGVSNFKPAALEALAKAPSTTVVPAVNQILLHVGNVDNATIQYCTARKITVEAYSPLGHPNGGGKAVYLMPEVVAIAKAHKKSGAQIALKYIVQRGHTLVTASGLSSYDQEDLDMWSFTLTDEDMATLDAVKQL